MLPALMLIGVLIGYGEDANPGLQKQITTVVTSALQASGQKFDSVAVLAQFERRSPANLDAPDRIDALRKLLESLVKSSGFEVVHNSEFENAVRQLDIHTPIRPSDVTRIRRITDVDGVLTSTWSNRNNRQIVRLSLVAPNGVVWTRTLTAALDDVIEVSAEAKSGGEAPGPLAGADMGQSDLIAAARILGIAGSGGFMPRQGTDGTTALPTDGSTSIRLGGANGNKVLPGDRKAPVSDRDGLASKVSNGSNKTEFSNRGLRNGRTSDLAASANPTHTPDAVSAEPTSSANGSPASRDDRLSGSNPLNTASRSSRAAGTASNVPEANRKVLEFASNNLGRQVGNGECWTLAAEALAYADAQPPRGYSFGRELASSEQPLPGDIMQFTTCRFQDRNFTAVMGLPNHTAIVYAVDGDKTTFIHQNFGSRMVTLLTLDMTTRVGGTYSAYRPLPRESR